MEGSAGEGTAAERGLSIGTVQGLQGAQPAPAPTVTFCKKTICQSREWKKGLSFTSWALWGDVGHPGWG